MMDRGRRGFQAAPGVDEEDSDEERILLDQQSGTDLGNLNLQAGAEVAARTARCRRALDPDRDIVGLTEGRPDSKEVTPRWDRF